MPNPNPKNVSQDRYEELVENVMRAHSCSRARAEHIVDPGLAAFPATPPAGMITRQVAKIRSIWKGGSR